MPEARPPSNSNKLSLVSQESPAIVVTSLRPKERPLSVRQQRLAQFCSSGAGRKRRKETSRREFINRKAIRNRTAVSACTAAVAVTITGSFKAWNQSLVGPSMEQTEESPTQSDHVKILYAARDILYSDSDLALLSSCSSCLGKQERRDIERRVSTKSVKCPYSYDLMSPEGDDDPSLSRESTGSITWPYPNDMMCRRWVDDTPSRLDRGSFKCPADMMSPRPCGRVGLVDGSSGVGNRYLNKPLKGFMPSEDVVDIFEGMERKNGKPCRQVWHNLWEHQVGSSKSAKTTKQVNRLVSGKEARPEQATASASNIRFVHDSLERKQRRGVFHPTGPMIQTRVTYRSKNLNRPWGRAIHQRVPLTGTRVAQRKVSLMKDGNPIEDSESLLEKKPKLRRCELTGTKSIPRVVVTTAPRPATAVSPEKEDAPSPAHPKSAPSNPRRATPENFTNRLGHFGKPSKPSNRPRFSVPIKASRVPMDLLFKEMYSQKTDWTRKDTDIGRSRGLKYRGIPARVSNVPVQPFPNLSQDAAGSCRDARLAAHFSIPDRNRTSTLQNARRLLSSPLYNQASAIMNESDSNIGYSPSFNTGGECKPMSVHDALSTQRTCLQRTGRYTERGARLKTLPANVNHFYDHPIASKESAIKSPFVHNYSMEPDDMVNTGCRFRAPTAGLSPLFKSDLAVPPDYLYDGHVVSDQTSTAFRFSHPNAPDVLISPPPNPQHRGDSLCVPGSVSDVEAPPGTMFSNLNASTVGFVSRYYGLRSPESIIEENYMPLQPFFQPNVPFRPFMPSVDFSRLEPAPRPHPFSYIRDNDQRQYGRDGQTPFSANLQPVCNPTADSSVVPPSEKAAKPLKQLLTFGAQVPSSQRIQIKTCTCLNSRLKTQDTNIYCPRDQLQLSEVSNAFSEGSPNSRERKGLDLNPMECKDPGEYILDPFSQHLKTDSGLESGNTEKPYCVETTNAMEEKDGVDKIFMLDRIPEENSSSQYSTPRIEGKRPDEDFFQPITNAFPVVDRVSVQSSQAAGEFAIRQFEFGKPKPYFEGANLYTYSDTKLSTVTETSAEAQQREGSFLTEVSGFGLDSTYAADTPVAFNPEVEPEPPVFQLAENNASTEEVEKYDTVTAKGNAIKDLSANQDVSGTFRNSDITPDDPITDLHDGVSGGNLETRYSRRISDCRSSCTDSTTYPVFSACQQFTNKKRSFTGSSGTCQDDVFEENRVTSMQSGSARCRFQSLVARVDAHHHISVQCKLSGKLSNLIDDIKSGISEGNANKKSIASRHTHEKVNQKDVSVQVPVLCCQCVETEPYTTEKGVPDCRAGLTLRLMSTVVDVPPVIKSTVCVGTNTEEDTERDGSPRFSTVARQDSESRLTCDQLCTSSARSSSPVSFDFSGDRRRPVVSAMDKKMKRLKPFFRSHCSELANVYTLAAVHSVTFNAEKDRSSTLPKEEKLGTDSNTSTEIRKDRRHSASSDDDPNYSCEHEQPGRTPKQHARDRRVSFRPVRRESDIFFPPSDDKRSRHKHHVNEPFQNRDIARGLVFAEDLRQSKMSENLSGTHENVNTDHAGSSSRPALQSTENAEVTGRAHRSGRRAKYSSSKYRGELLESNGRLPENFDVDVIALKREPGCALCKKDRSVPSKKKSILKNSKESGGKHKTHDIPRSLLQFGLSSIITPVDNNTEEEVVITGTYNSALGEETPQSEVRRHQSRKTVKYLKTLASLVALESSKKSESCKLEKDRCFIKDDRPMTVADDRLDTYECQKNFGGNIDTGAMINSSKPSGCTRSTVPTICLTRADSNDVLTLEDPASKNPVEFLVDLIQPKDCLEGNHLKKSRPVVDIPSKESTPLYMRTCSEKVDTMSRRFSSDSSKQIRNLVVDPCAPQLNPTKTITKKLKQIAAYGCLKEFEEDVIVDDVVGDKQAPPPYIDDPNERFDSAESSKRAYSLQSSMGCMFTAMKRYMKSRQRPEWLCADNWDQRTDCNDGYPKLRFTDVPLNPNECPLGGRVYCNRCNLRDQNWLPEEFSRTFDLYRKRVPRRCSTDPAGFTPRSQKHFSKVCDLRKIADLPEVDEMDKESSSHSRRGNSISKVDNPQNKILWQSVLRSRYDEAKPTSPLTPDRFDSDGDKSGTSELFEINENNISGDFPVLKLISCPESTEYRHSKSPKQAMTCALSDEEEHADKPTRGIRTLPREVASIESILMRYPRCASDVPQSSPVSSRSRPSARSSSAPAGEVRISHGRCWPPAHSVYKVARGPRRLVHKHVRLLECDSFTCDRCEHRKTRQRIPSGLVNCRNDDELFLVVDDSQDDLDDYRHTVKCCSRRRNRRDC